MHFGVTSTVWGEYWVNYAYLIFKNCLLFTLPPNKFLIKLIFKNKKGYQMTPLKVLYSIILFNVMSEQLYLLLCKFQSKESLLINITSFSLRFKVKGMFYICSIGNIVYYLFMRGYFSFCSYFLFAAYKYWDL